MNDDKDQNKPKREDQKKPKDEGKQEGFETDGLDEDGNPLDGGNYLDQSSTDAFRTTWFRSTRPRNPFWFNFWYSKAREAKIALLIKKSPHPIASSSNNWLSVGPRNINGRVKCIAVSPNDPNKIYAGAASGGVWRSIDGGRKWEPYWPQNINQSIGAISINSSNDDEILVGTGEAVGIFFKGNYHNFPGDGIYIYNGVTINHHPYSSSIPDADLEFRSISKVLYTNITCEGSNIKYYVASPDGFFGVTDSGEWRYLSYGPDNLPTDFIVCDAAIDPENPSIIYLCVHEKGIYRSIDGCTFSKLEIKKIVGTSDPEDFDDSEWIWPKISLWNNAGNEDNRFFAIQFGKYCYAGNLALTSGTLVEKIGEVSTRLGWSSCVSVQPKVGTELRPNTIIFGGKYLAVYSDNSGDYVKVENDTITGVHEDQQQVVFTPTYPEIVFLANDGGVFRSNSNGFYWIKISLGLKISQFYALGNWNKYGTAMGGGTQDTGVVATAGGLTWENVLNGDGGYFQMFNDKPFEYLTERTSSPIIKINDGVIASETKSYIFNQNSPADVLNIDGCEEELKDSGAPWIRVLYKHINPVSNEETYYTGASKVYKYLPDPIDKWKILSKKLSNPESSVAREDSISAISVAPSDKNFIYVGIGSILHRRSPSSNVFMTDHAESIGCPNETDWQDITGPDMGEQIVTDIVVDKVNPEVVYVSLGWGFKDEVEPLGFVYVGIRNSSGEYSWTNLTPPDSDCPLPRIGVNALVLDPNISNYLYVGTDIGVFFTDLDDPGNWFTIIDNDRMPEVIVSDLVIDQRNNSLFASTFGRGIYRLYLEPKPPVNLYVRTNILDTGENIPINNGDLNPLKKLNRVFHWHSPDIKIQPYPVYYSYGIVSMPAMDGIEFDEIKSDTIETDYVAIHFVFVQIHNRGPETANNVKVCLYAANNSACLEDLPAEYQECVEGDPNSWHKVGNEQTISTLFPNEPIILKWPWNPNIYETGNYAFFVFLSCDEDKYTNLERNPDLLAKNERKCALKKVINHRLFFNPDIAYLNTICVKRFEAYKSLPSIKFRPSGINKGRMGVFFPKSISKKILKANPNIKSVAISENEVRDHWIGKNRVRDEGLEQSLELIDTSLIFELNRDRETIFREIPLEKGETSEILIFGDRKTQNLRFLEIIQEQDNSLVTGETFEFDLATINHPGNIGFTYIRIILEKIEILRRFDFWCSDGEKFSFSTMVNLPSNTQSIIRVLPSSPQRFYRINQLVNGRVLTLNEVIFEGYVPNNERFIELTIAGKEFDFLSDDDELITYRRKILGPVKFWKGKFIPNDEKNDAENLYDWKISYRIEQLFNTV